MAVSVHVDHVGKAYRLGVANRRALLATLRQSLTGEEEDLFWALREVAFEVHQGDVVGILGHNGAGKSTLLKILAQITTPTRGRVLLRGRVASLLEVGTGFHPELTGRENVYLNGTILGLRRYEITQKFKEIVDFADLATFIDTPAKRYSSGMRVRLAFAVAAHLDPEILIIDEVLAVGDASFQQKCLGKISDVARDGRTVLFVSHNAAAVEGLCNRGLVLNRGRLEFDGTQTQAIAYYSGQRANAATCLAEREDRKGTGAVRINRIEVRNAKNPAAGVHSGDDVEIWLHFQRAPEMNFPKLVARMVVTNHMGVPVFFQANWVTGKWFGELPETGALVCQIPRVPLAEGTYHMDYRIMTNLRGGELLDALEGAAQFEVGSGNFFGAGTSVPANVGSALVEGQWRLEPA